MNKNNSDIDSDFDANDFTEIDEHEIDEHEYEISATSNRPIRWRRIELLREKLELKKQLADYDDLMNGPH